MKRGEEGCKDKKMKSRGKKESEALQTLLCLYQEIQISSKRDPEKKKLLRFRNPHFCSSQSLMPEKSIDTIFGSSTEYIDVPSLSKIPQN